MTSPAMPAADGRIRRAREARLGRLVALKELIVEPPPDAEGAYPRGADSPRALQHPSHSNLRGGRWAVSCSMQ
jgi:hypothetical protein